MFDLRDFMASQLPARDFKYFSEPGERRLFEFTRGIIEHGVSTEHTRAEALLASISWQVILSLPSINEQFNVMKARSRNTLEGPRNYIFVSGDPGNLRYDLLVMDPQASDDYTESGLVNLPREAVSKGLHIWRTQVLELQTDPLSRALVDLVNEHLVLEMIQSKMFAVVLTKAPEMIYTAVPSPGWLLSVKDGSGSVSTVGSVVKRFNNQVGVTMARHAFDRANVPIVPGNTTVQVNGFSGIVESVDVITDSCFVSLEPSQIRNLAWRGTRGPLRGVTPRGNSSAQFEGKNGAQRTTIIGWNDYVPRQLPYTQAVVLTTPDTQDGDSGAALVDEDDYIVGFCMARTGLGERIKAHSVWVWADSVYTKHQLTDLR